MKLGKGSFFSLVITVLFLSFFLVSCSQSQHDNTARVKIDLGANGIAAKGESSSLVDKIVNIITLSRAANAAAPSNITSYQVNVTAPDMAAITESYSAGSTSIEIDIPAGSQRKIVLTANIDPADNRAVLAYSGSVTVDLKSGETKDITFTMCASETKLVIPDYYNSRVVLIDDMKGTNWKTLTGNNVNGPSPFKPSDIAFDAQGRIYFANPDATAGYNIFRIDSIATSENTTAESIIGTVSGSRWVSIDIKNSILYFATSTMLYKAGLDGNGHVDTGLEISSGLIRGINVDDEGNVYIAYGDGEATNIVAKFNPSDFNKPLNTFDVFSQFKQSNYIPKDVVIKSGNVFVAVSGPLLSANLIVQLDSNLQYVKSYGTGATDTDAGHFYGPNHFVATLNRKLYIINDGESDTRMFDNLVSMDDIDGTNWETYGERGSSTGQFNFYSYSVC